MAILSFMYENTPLGAQAFLPASYRSLRSYPQAGRLRSQITFYKACLDKYARPLLLVDEMRERAGFFRHRFSKATAAYPSFHLYLRNKQPLAIPGRISAGVPLFFPSTYTLLWPALQKCASNAH